jgi:hypothetical protein
MKGASIFPIHLQRLNWSAVATSIANLPPNLHIFTTKLITGWLPTGTRLERYGNIITKCHRCNQAETVDHIFQCSGRSDTNKAIISKLSLYLESIHTSPQITKVFTRAFQEWLLPHEPRSPMEMSEQIRSCYDAQTNIGWNLAARGLFDQGWSILQETGNRNGTHDRWQAKVSSWLVQQAHSTWCERNNEIHQPDDTASRQELETRAQITKLYELAAAQLTIHDRNKIFSETLQQRLLRPAESNRIWATQVYSAVRNSIHRNQQNKGLQDIRNFFQPTAALGVNTQAGEGEYRPVTSAATALTPQANHSINSPHRHTNAHQAEPDSDSSETTSNSD